MESSSPRNIPTQKAAVGKMKRTLKKKAEELATLYRIPVCLLYFGPDGKVATYPEDRKEVTGVISRYRDSRRDDTNGAVGEKKKKKKKQNKKSKPMPDAYEPSRLDCLPEEYLKHIFTTLEKKLEAVDQAIKLKEEESRKSLASEQVGCPLGLPGTKARTFSDTDDRRSSSSRCNGSSTCEFENMDAQPSTLPYKFL